MICAISKGDHVYLVGEELGFQRVRQQIVGGGATCSFRLLN